MRKNLLITLLTVAIAAQAQTMDDSPTHSPYIKDVLEYLPAPGQFVNTLPAATDSDTPATMAAKCAELIAQGRNDIVTLGAYGGYITFGFDHSIANIAGQSDLYIRGNCYNGNSEPGIVMVSKDINRNGIADDPWYEIAGSADTDNAGQIVFNYEITYTPNPLGDIQWTDNQGQSGTIDRNEYHEQEYFPLWHEGALNFRGTLLPKNAVNQGTSTEYWVLSSFRYGYVDNYPNTNVEACSIDISWAVDINRHPANLDFIDFVRVYNGENQKCGWIGETSTEVGSAEDLHLEASLQAITAAISTMTASPKTIVSRHTLDGRKAGSHTKGIIITRYSDGSIIKSLQ